MHSGQPDLTFQYKIILLFTLQKFTLSVRILVKFSQTEECHGAQRKGNKKIRIAQNVLKLILLLEFLKSNEFFFQNDHLQGHKWAQVGVSEHNSATMHKGQQAWPGMAWLSVSRCFSMTKSECK